MTPLVLDASAGVGSPTDATVGRRAVARLVDFSVGVALFFATAATISAAGGPAPDGTGVMIGAIGVTFLVYLVYEVVLVGVWGRTLGKRLLGLEVVRADGGGRPGLRRSFLRNLLPTLLLIAFFPLYPLPYLAVALANDHRWPSDRLAGTRVVLRLSITRDALDNDAHRSFAIPSRDSERPSAGASGGHRRFPFAFLFPSPRRLLLIAPSPGQILADSPAGNPLGVPRLPVGVVWRLLVAGGLFSVVGQSSLVRRRRLGHW